MPTYRMTLSYDGTHYQGWQVQAGDAPTIQGQLQQRLSRLEGKAVTVRGSGRTDAGVHALGQVAAFTLSKASKTPGTLKATLNAMLPSDIRVRALRRAPEDFNPQTWALRKTYTYTLATDPVLSPFERHYALHLLRVPDCARIRKALRLLLGRHDFKSFQGAGSSVKDTVRHIFRASLRKKGPKLIITLEANGFLRYMVRNIVGTMLEVGRDRMAPEQVSTILEARDRRLAGPTAPPQGLRLEKVVYGTTRPR